MIFEYRLRSVLTTLKRTSERLESRNIAHAEIDEQIRQIAADLAVFYPSSPLNPKLTQENGWQSDGQIA